MGQARTTRPADAGEGWTLRVEAGVRQSEGPAGVPSGTTVCVADLFFNVPARLKFLKSDASERSHLFRAAEDAALSNPGVSWRVSSESKEAWALPAVSEDRWADRLAALWGEERAGGMKEIATRENYVSVEHLKRYTTLGMGTDQGRTSNVNGLAVLAELTGRSISEVGTTSFRPMFSAVRKLSP